MTTEEKANIYLNNSLNKELQNTLYPKCDQTCGEVCIEDYTSGYNQAIEDSDELRLGLKYALRMLNNSDAMFDKEYLENLLK